MPNLLFFILMILAAPASATSMESVVPVSADLLLQEEPAPARTPTDLPDALPQLSEAYSSLYWTVEDRRKNEREALLLGVLGGLAGYAGAAIGGLATGGIGLVSAPAAVVIGAAYGVHPYFNARFGWEVFGASIGTLASVVLAVSAGFFNRVAEDSGIRAGTVLFGITVLAVGPGIGAWIAGVTDQDNLERDRLKLTVATDGIGIRGRF